jgi:hypothetical protein
MRFTFRLYFYWVSIFLIFYAGVLGLMSLFWGLNMNFWQILLVFAIVGMLPPAIKGLIHRKWLNDAERETYPKSWCKPIDVSNPEMGVAALKYTFKAGADVIIPPGDFRNFAFCVDHIEEIINEPLTQKEMTLLDNEFLAVKDYPFFNPQA